MDPAIERPRHFWSNSPSSASSVQAVAGQVAVFHSSFDAVGGAAHVSLDGLISQAAVRPVLWDVAVRRFASPSYHGTNRHQLVARMDSARRAYAKAFVAIQKSVKDVDAAAILSHSSESDVAQLALELFDQPTSTADDKGRVSQFIDLIHHYHGVFDVLSQAGDFGYLPVIWGGVKLLLMFAKNKRELLSKVTDMLIEIGWSLSRIEVYAALFPTARMVELISMLYAAVADFLQDVVLHFAHKSTVRKVLSSFVRPFEERFGRAMDRISRLVRCIESDALALHALQTRSMAQRQMVDAALHHHHVQATLSSLPLPPHPLGPRSPSTPSPSNIFPDLFHQIRHLLFHNFPSQATYHESLAATYSVTARAWEKWFAVEQRYLPSSAVAAVSLDDPDRNGNKDNNNNRSTVGKARLSHGLCDAPDYQHALQWAAQQRRLTPHIPSAYLIWAQGMTVHTALASLIFQVLQQRPGVVAEHNLDMDTFKRAASSVKRLWDLFVYLMKVLGGSLIYISIGSAGPDEFALVEKFVNTVRNWEGPPIWVTLIHPYHDGFVGMEEATDLDGLYDVHPSLCVTDALHHVLMLELDIHQVDSTIQTVLWEAVWRETRYASVGVSLTLVVDAIQRSAEELSRQQQELRHEARGPVLGDTERELWVAAVQEWINDPVASNELRELVQRHLDIVDLALPHDIRAAINRHLKRLVLVRIDEDKASSFASRSMTQIQRSRVWERMKEAIRPAAEVMFCGTILDVVADTLDSYATMPCQTEGQAGLVVMKLMNERFGRDGTWNLSMSLDEQLMVQGIMRAIIAGFEDTLDALSEPEGVEEGSDYI